LEAIELCLDPRRKFGSEVIENLSNILKANTLLMKQELPDDRQI